MKCFMVEKNDAGQRLDRFLLKAIPTLPYGLMHKYIRLKRIKVNHKRSDPGYMLELGDIVEAYINDEFFIVVEEEEKFLHAGTELDIVHEDENILIINKPVGLLSHEDNAGEADTLVNRIKHYLYKNKKYDPKEEQTFSPAICNRLDRNTMGLVIAAKNSVTLRMVNEKIKMREIRKYYLCVVSGKMPHPSDTVSAYCAPNTDEENKMPISLNYTSKYSVAIKSKYRVVSESENYTLLEVELITGKQHQIRAHYAFLGHPILGDLKYGGAEYVRKPRHLSFRLSSPVFEQRQLLCAYKLKFSFFTTANELNYLNQREFILENIWFCEEFMRGNIQ